MTLKRLNKERQQLCQLAGLAYERELSAASQALLQDFIRWEKKEIDVFQLNEKIYEFHNGISRELYVRYTGMDVRVGVARALHIGILNRDEVTDDIFISVQDIILVFSKLQG